MCAPDARVVALAARLTAVTGHSAWTEELPGRVRIGAALPPQLTEPRRRLLLQILASTDRYGHDVTAHGVTVWAEIRSSGTRRSPNTDS